MPADPNIGNREREILTALVETFISTGEPVGSRTLARSNREGLSPASIRNVMADLSDAGFLEQPHASAGRVPTTEAYRYYVEQISGSARLAPQEETMISDSLAGITDVQEFMERTSHVLSLISRNVGVTQVRAREKALSHMSRNCGSAFRSGLVGKPWRNSRRGVAESGLKSAGGNA